MIMVNGIIHWLMPKAERRIFDTLLSTAAIFDYLQDNYDKNYDQGWRYDFDVNTIMDDDLENTKDRPLHKPSQDQRKSTALGRAWNFVERCIMYSSEKHYYK